MGTANKKIKKMTLFSNDFTFITSKTVPIWKLSRLLTETQTNYITLIIKQNNHAKRIHVLITDI